MTYLSKTFPGFDQIYKMRSTGSETEFIGHMDIPAGCDKFDVLRGRYASSRPIQVSWALGKSQPGDVVWTTWAVPVIVSAKVVSLLEATGFSGWSTYPVVLTNKAGDVVNGYSGLSVTGRCGEIDNSRCERVEREFPGGVFPMYRGLYFNESRWDGSDIFCSKTKTGYVFVMPEVKVAFQEAKIRNVVFEALTDIERSML